MARMLTPGCIGQEVRTLQQMLNFHFGASSGSLLAVDGVYGARTGAAVRRLQSAAQIQVDGIVGPQTVAALFPLMAVTGGVIMQKLEAPASLMALAGLCGMASSRSPDYASCMSCLSPVRCMAMSARAMRSNLPVRADAAGAGDPAPDPPVINIQNVVVSGGNNFAWRPWAPSPFVAAAGATIVWRWGDGWGMKFGPQGQFAVNGVGSPNGAWTGQGAIQLMPVIPGSDRYTKFLGGRLDLGLPFLQGFAQLNAGQPWQGGGAIGIQPAFTLIPGPDDPILSLMINAQLLAAWRLNDGQGQPMSPQIMGAIGLDVWQLFFAK